MAVTFQWMLQGKRQSLHSDCRSDFSQTILRLMNAYGSEAESTPRQLLRLFRPFRLYVTCRCIISGECSENIKVVICFDCTSRSRSRHKNIWMCLFWSFSLFCWYFLSDILSHWVHSLGPVCVTYVFLVITEKALKLFPVWQLRDCQPSSPTFY